ncbi:ABC transporter permease [Actinocorallia sp. A-T 12471]|uniref:ABC transporter permease n=1 Tax=Actinocorallia sp. A-T 12471 TaxID=3089813 RepID=UPI0029CF83D7|nr:ABC transporter permease [Actinocorallia sp. A-T 12471]MDX6740595.1 ABC transporter permease [Actinocorallia sp. A-T 12471]
MTPTPINDPRDARATTPGVPRHRLEGEPQTGRALPGGRTLPIFVVLAVLLVAIAFSSPHFLEPQGFLSFVRRAAPLAVLAVGQYLVIVSGEFDLSVGALVTAEVVVAAQLIDGDASATFPVLLLMLAIGALVGLANGLVTTALRVPAFIATLGMMLIINGLITMWNGGAPKGALSEPFRELGRGNIGPIPWSVVVLAAVAVGFVTLMRTDFGKNLVATGENHRAAAQSGIRVTRTKTIAFVLSGLTAAICAILLGGYAGVSSQLGQGLEFQAVTAVVVGGVALGGGRGSIVAALAGAFTLEALFTLLNLHGIAGAVEFTVQGVILIAAVALGAVRLPWRT